MKRLKIYVAGPITSDNPEEVRKNILKARKVGEAILKKGHFPYVPHVHFSGWDVDIYEYYDTFQAHGEEIIEKWADALFFISSSNGANAERAKAEKLGLKIFTNLEEIPDFKPLRNVTYL